MTNKFTGWDSIRHYIDTAIDQGLRIKNPSELEAAVNSFTSVVVELAEKATPQKDLVANRESLYPRQIREILEDGGKTEGDGNGSATQLTKLCSIS